MFHLLLVVNQLRAACCLALLSAFFCKADSPLKPGPTPRRPQGSQNEHYFLHIFKARWTQRWLPARAICSWYEVLGQQAAPLSGWPDSWAPGGWSQQLPMQSMAGHGRLQVLGSCVLPRASSDSMPWQNHACGCMGSSTYAHAAMHTATRPSWRPLTYLDCQNMHTEAMTSAGPP